MSNPVFWGNKKNIVDLSSAELVKNRTFTGDDVLYTKINISIHTGISLFSSSLSKYDVVRTKKT